MSINSYENLIKFSKTTGIPVKKILDMLHILKDGTPIDNYTFIRKLGLSKASVNLIQREFHSWFKPVDKTTSLSQNGMAAVSLFIGSNYQPEDSFTAFLTDRTNEILKSSQKFYTRRPESKREYDQFHAEPETTAKRAALMNHLSDVQYRKILFIGDDDLTSLTLSALRLSAEITVMDIDTRILKVIDEICKEEGFKITTIQHDIRKPLPKNLMDQFDVVFTDPPYTPNGISLFLSRAIQALNYKNKTARIYFCYGNSDLAKDRFAGVYKLISEMNLMPRWVFDKFNRYMGAESIGSASTLFICEATGVQKPLIMGQFQGNIYTNQ